MFSVNSGVVVLSVQANDAEKPKKVRRKRLAKVGAATPLIPFSYASFLIPYSACLAIPSHQGRKKKSWRKEEDLKPKPAIKKDVSLLRRLREETGRTKALKNLVHQDKATQEKLAPFFTGEIVRQTEHNVNQLLQVLQMIQSLPADCVRYLLCQQLSAYVFRFLCHSRMVVIAFL